MSTVDSTSVLPELDIIFLTFGIPEKFVTDNGAPFNVALFKNFCEHFGEQHRKIPPLWPRANGIRENFMKNLSQVIRNRDVTKKAFSKELNEFLRNNRSTIHCSTKSSPSDLLFGREKTTRLTFNKGEQARSNEGSAKQQQKRLG